MEGGWRRAGGRFLVLMAAALACSLPLGSTFSVSLPLATPATTLARASLQAPLAGRLYAPAYPVESWGRSQPRRWQLRRNTVVSVALQQAADAEASEADSKQEDYAAQAFFQAPGVSVRDIMSMTVPQLKDELRERGLKVGGRKDELIQRLNDAIDGKIASPGRVSTSKAQPRVAVGSKRSSGVAASSKADGGGIRLAEGERLPVAPPLPKRALGGSMKRIFVKGVPFRASPRDLACILEDAFGPVEKLEGMMLDGRSSGRAWVTFENAEIAKEAVQESRIEMDGRPIFFSPPWSLAARQALRDMADIAAYQSEPRGDTSPQAGRDANFMARPGRDITTDYVPASGMVEEQDEVDLDEPGGRTLFVGRVPLDADDDDIREGLAEMGGGVERVYMGRTNRKDPQSDFAGYAHVVMKDQAGVATAISSPVFIKGERVRIDRAMDGAKEQREERFPLEERYHGSLIGVAGRTVAELERQSGARITFEMRPTPCMVVKGSPLQRRAAWQAAQQALAALGTESMDVAQKYWSVVIGVGGANIRRIESQTGARLQLEADPDPHLKIQGMPDSRKQAKALIREILEREEQELFPVDAKFHGLLVGKRGMTVKELQRDSGAIISFVKKPQAGMVAKGLLPQRDRAWAVTQHVIEQLPIVLAEMRGVDRETAAAELDDTFGPRFQRPVSEDSNEEAPNPRADEVWEEAVARALQRAKDLLNEEREAQKRRERGYDT